MRMISGLDIVVQPVPKHHAMSAALRAAALRAVLSNQIPGCPDALMHFPMDSQPYRVGKASQSGHERAERHVQVKFQLTEAGTFKGQCISQLSKVSHAALAGTEAGPIQCRYSH